MPHDREQRDRDALVDIFNAASEAVGFNEDLTCDQFLADRKTQLAVLHLITLIGEASRRTDASFRMHYNELPWPQMMGIRNIIVHEYDSVDMMLVWDVLTRDLPALVQQIKPIIDNL